MKTLHLTLKKKWFDMIASGEKLEEYRAIKPYWKKRLLKCKFREDKSFTCTCDTCMFECVVATLVKFDTITFRNGYAKNAPELVVECKDIDVGKAKPEWSDNWKGDVFVISLGLIISVNRVDCVRARETVDYITKGKYYELVESDADGVHVIDESGDTAFFQNMYFDLWYLNKK